MEARLGDETGVSEDVIASSGEDVMDMMAWWEQEQKLPLANSIATSST
jgi:hypothetical protein